MKRNFVLKETYEKVTGNNFNNAQVINIKKNYFSNGIKARTAFHTRKLELSSSWDDGLILENGKAVFWDNDNSQIDSFFITGLELIKIKK